MTDARDPGPQAETVLLTALPPEDTARGRTAPGEEQETDLEPAQLSWPNLSTFKLSFYIE